MDSRLRGKDNDIFVMCFVILAKAGINACSGKTPLEAMDSRLRGKDNDIFVMYREIFGMKFLKQVLSLFLACSCKSVMIAGIFYRVLFMTATTSLRLPNFDAFIDAIAVLALPFSASELHGVMCGFLCAGAIPEGETYLRALMTNSNQEATRITSLAIFGVYAVSHQQMSLFDFEFQLFLPDDDAPLANRAEAFSEWCSGFIEGFALAGGEIDSLQEEESQEALQHLEDFAHLDYQALKVTEEDERAFVDVSEYARMAVLRIYSDMQLDRFDVSESHKAH